MPTRYKVFALVLANLAAGAVVYDLIEALHANWAKMVMLIATQRPSEEIIDFMSMGFKMSVLCTLMASAAFAYLFARSMAHFALWQTQYKRDRHRAQRLSEGALP